MPPGERELCTHPFLVTVELYIREGKSLATDCELVSIGPEAMEPGQEPLPPGLLLPQA